MQTMSLGRGAFVWSKRSGASLTIERTEDGLVKIITTDVELVIEPAHKAFAQCMIHTDSSISRLEDQ